MCQEELGGKGLASIEDSVDTSIQRLEDFIEKRGGRLVTTTRNNTNDTRTSGTTITRKQRSVEKQLNGRFKRLTSDISHENTKTWPRETFRETESLLKVAQNNAIRTNHIKARIDKTQQNTIECAKCSIGNCARIWSLTIWTNGICTTASILENETLKLLWDHQISARRPVLIKINEKVRTYRTVDLAVQAYHRVKLKECEKWDKYLDLARELKTLWNMKEAFIPIVIGALGTVTKGLIIMYEALRRQTVCVKKGGGRGLYSIANCVDISIQGFDEYIKKSKERLITEASNSNGIVRTNRNTTKLGNRNRRKNHRIDISRDKLARLYSRRCEHSYEREISRDKQILF